MIYNNFILRYILLYKKGITFDIIEDYIIPYEIDINIYICKDDLIKFKYFTKYKNDYNENLLIAIKYNAIKIVEYIFKKSKNINKFYNGYPLLYYSHNKEVDKFLRWTNDDSSSRVLVRKQIIENDLLAIAKKIFELKMNPLFYTIENEFIIDIANNHNHIMFKNSCKYYINDHYNDIDKLLKNIIINKDLYELNIYLKEFITENNLDSCISIICNNKNNLLSDMIEVYENHDDFTLPNKIKIKREEYYKNILYYIIKNKNEKIKISKELCIMLNTFNKNLFNIIKSHIIICDCEKKKKLIKIIIISIILIIIILIMIYISDFDYKKNFKDNCVCLMSILILLYIK